MHPRHGDDTGQIDRLTIIAATLLFALLAGAVVKFDLWQVPEDYSAAVPLQDTPASPLPAVATALKVN